ncbi:amidohydrolase family protein [Actinoplanes sp. NPDC049265]|uniref:amidohydrolase family protein n=1 Tax=Actinoplanes sp. NPDC049265 TaxID=3363902 RepID=UPI00370FAD13
MRIAIRAARLFDGTRMHGPSTVTVEDGLITTVGGDVAGDVLDLGDATLLPGLVDPHVHLVFDASPTAVPALIESDDATVLDRMRVAARHAVHAGITTVRDLGDRDYLTLALRTWPEGPEIIAAGPPITTPGGHCHFLGGTAAGPDALRAAVRERHERGCDLVKIMASGGRMTPGSPIHASQYTADDLRIVVDEAHRLGLPVAAHAHGVGAIRDALDAGVDTIEHLTFVTEDGVDTDPALVKALAAAPVALGILIGTVPGTPVPPAFQKQAAVIQEAWRKLHELGATVVAGTDAGINPAKPHDALVYAPPELVDLGWSPVEALSAVTSVAADVCRVGDRKGRIRPGADADLLAVAGDPSTDLARLRDVRAVFRAGVRIR